VGYALVASTSAASGDGNTVTTPGIDTTGADLLVLVVAGSTGSEQNPSDSKGNTWTGLTFEDVGGGERIKLYYVIGGTVGSGHTAGVASGLLPALAFYAFSHDGTPEFDAENAGGQNFGSTVQPGSVTPSADDGLIVQGVAFNVAGTFSINESYTGLVQQTKTANNIGGAGAYLIQTSAAATNPTWTHSPGSASMAAVGAVFKAAGGGGGRTTKNTRAWPLGVEVGMGHRMPC
jgi:hypothetical protein